MGGRAPGKNKAGKRAAVVDDPDDETIETPAEQQSTKANAGASSARKKKPKTLKDIVGFGDLAAGGGGGGGGPGGAKPKPREHCRRPDATRGVLLDGRRRHGPNLF